MGSWLSQSIPPPLLDLAAVTPSLRNLIGHLHEDGGRLRRAASLLRNDRSRYAERMRGLAAALDSGGLPDLQAGPPGPRPAVFNGRAVMALHASPPWLNNGYTIRTQCLLEELSRRGVHCTGVTRPNFPQDMAAFRDAPVSTAEEAGGQRYRRLSSADALWEGPLDRYIRGFADQLAEIARAQDASVIHAASNHVCGLAAALAAERIGARSVYEIRGLWHWSTVNRRPGWQNTESFALHEALERQAALRVDRVVVLSEALADHVRNWGMPAERIHCIGNGVALDRFKPEPREEALRAGWSATPESLVLGFVGTFAPYEGLDVLLEATALLRARGVDARPVLIGGGEMAPQLRAMARRLAVPVHFDDRIPHHQVPRALAAMDCCPFPRRAAGATLLVPPLKLAEAMACAIPVVVAAIPPLTEMVRDGATGRVVGHGAAALAEGLERVFHDRAGSRAMAEAARSWIVQNRSWQFLVDRLVQVWSA